MQRLSSLKTKLSDSLYEEAEAILYTSYNFRYDYLGFSLLIWEDFITTIVLNMPKNELEETSFAGSLSRRLNLAVRRYINRELSEGKTRVCNNLLIKLQKNSYKQAVLLKEFIGEFAHLGISFTDNIYNLLKNSCPHFKKSLELLGMINMSKDEFIYCLVNKYKLDVESNVNGVIDYDDLSKKYANLSFEEIKELYGDEFNYLPNNSKRLLERYFSITSYNGGTLSEAEKEINLLQYGYKRKSIAVNIKDLKKVYRTNKEKFSLEERLYLECFVFNVRNREEFKHAYPNSSICRSSLITKLEKLYYGIDDLFSYTLTKKQYLEVLELYPNKIDGERREILDLYYGVKKKAVSVRKLSKMYDKSYEEMRGFISNAKKYFLSLYCNLNRDSKIDKDIYIPYILDERYEMSSDAREVLKLLLIDNLSYEEIALKVKRKNVPSTISEGIQAIDAYRFGINILKSNVSINVKLTVDDIKEEIERHPADSVITSLEKEIISYYLGIKSEFNPQGEKLIGKDIQKKLGINSDISKRNKVILDKIKKRKVGNIRPEFMYMERGKLDEALKDAHLPITSTDREIICSLLGLKKYPMKTCEELAEEFGVAEKSIKRRYKVAIININKYLLGEKEGKIDYITDILPNLKYFTLSERILLEDYYGLNMTYEEIAEKHKIPFTKVRNIMYRIKTYLKELITNPNAKKFDYDYYHNIIDNPNFPFRGNLELAKRIFDLYVGDSGFGRTDIDEIKNILNLNLSSVTISRIIDSLVLGVYKYKEGIRKENSFSFEEVKDFYAIHKNNLSGEEMQLFSSYFNKNVGVDYKMSYDLIYLILKNKRLDLYSFATLSRNNVMYILKNFKNKLSKYTINTLKGHFNISERDLMTGQEKKHLFRLLNELDRELAKENAQNRVLSCSH